MNAFLALKPGDRKLLCQEARVKLGLGAVSLEKDFWVSWILRELFAIPGWGPYLAFKGGTSLSKAWQFIERFSEDIDVVIDREFLGFGGERLSRSQLNKLKETCALRIREELVPAFDHRLKSQMPPDDAWTLMLAPPEEDPDQQTLLFHYPTVFEGESGYVSPVVKIELGARSEIEPAESRPIRPLLVEAYPDVIGTERVMVRTVAARRTFWEKVMLIHEEMLRPPEKSRKARLSRHYYDLWCLIRKGVAREAVADSGLFERVARHRQVFFRYGWMDYSTLVKGRMRIVPPEDQLLIWR